MTRIFITHLYLLAGFLFCSLSANAFAIDWHVFDYLAKQQVGIPYHFGGDTPEKGFDCSGLVEYVYAKVGKPLPHGTRSLIKIGRPVSKKDLKPGDLVFFKPGAHISHVGIYLGDGIVIHAPSTGHNVTVMDVFHHIYWKNKIACFRRVVDNNFFTHKSL